MEGMNGSRSTPHIDDISHITRREIQAPVAACLINAYAEVLGREKAIEIATDALREDAKKTGVKAAEAYGGNGMRELARYIREVWTKNDALTINVLEFSDCCLRFDVTRCRYAELYERLGLRELGNCLSCCRDEPFAGGFNPRIRLTRKHTIMAGDKMCTFLFEME